MNPFDPVESFKTGIREWLDGIASDFATAAVEFAAKYISQPTNLADQIPYFNELVIGAQTIGGTLCLIFFYKRLLTAMRDMATEEDDPNYAEIVGSAAISAGLIASLPLFIKSFLIPISNQMVMWIASFPVDFDLAGDIIGFISPEQGLATAALHVLFMAVIWAIGFFVLTIAAMLRLAHLTIAVIIGCIVMAAHTNRAGVLKTYFTELIAIIFTQPLHMLIYAIVVWLGAKGTFESLLLSLAFIIVGIMGPHVIKQYIHTTGVAGGATGAGRFAAYKFMFRGFKS